LNKPSALEDEDGEDTSYEKNNAAGNVHFPRGGSQSDEGMYYPQESTDYLVSNPYDMVRQHDYEQLHQQLQPHPVYQPPHPSYERKMLTTKSSLLERVFGLPWAMKCEQIRQASPYGNVKGWRLASFIMKAGEDIRRESLVMQVISKMNEWFQTEIPEKHRPVMRPYTIMCVGGDAGLLECLSDAKSIDEVKKKTDGFVSLRDYFERAYGPPSRSHMPSNFNAYPHGPQVLGAPPPSQSGEISFDQAQDNFLRSLVGYSLVCYVLQIKDRHNANILLDREGHIMHIDFGFVLGDTPKMGKVPLFSERAPFKLTTEFWEVLGGWNFHEGGLGVKFCRMFEIAFACASAHVEEITSVVEGAMLNLSRDPNTARALANGVRSRLRMHGPAGSVQQKTFIMDLINNALTSWGTSTYDWLQKYMNDYQ
jgi:phosphatidylinositol 4-kinase